MPVTAWFGSFLLFIVESQERRCLLSRILDVPVLLVQVFDSNSFHHPGWKILSLKLLAPTFELLLRTLHLFVLTAIPSYYKTKDLRVA